LQYHADRQNECHSYFSINTFCSHSTFRTAQETVHLISSDVCTQHVFPFPVPLPSSLPSESFRNDRNIKITIVYVCRLCDRVSSSRLKQSSSGSLLLIVAHCCSLFQLHETEHGSCCCKKKKISVLQHIDISNTVMNLHSHETKCGIRSTDMDKRIFWIRQNLVTF